VGTDVVGRSGFRIKERRETVTNPVRFGGFSAGQRWLSLLAVLVVGAVVLAACGGDDNDNATSTPAAPANTPTAAQAANTPTVAALAPTEAASPEGSPSPIGSPVTSPEVVTSPVIVPSPVTSPEVVESPVASPAASASAVIVTGPVATAAASPQTSPVTSPAASPTEVVVVPQPTVAASPSASPQASPAASPVGSPVGSPVASPAATNSVTVDLLDIRFDPKNLTIPANTDVTITMTNKGVAPHNFSIDALHIDQDVNPGETKTVTVNAPAGSYQFYCNVPGHKEAGMVGTLTVQ